MAEKRITTVDEIMTMDADADYVLVSRGVQQDLRRILLRRLPLTFDLHDDIADELTTLAGVDRLLVSDEGTVGHPQKYVKLSTLRAFFLDLFDLHDDVPTELTAAAAEDRLLISDESEAGDPQKWISVDNLRVSLISSVMTFVKVLVSRTDLTPNALDVSHTLGKVPIGYSLILTATAANNNYAIGDEVILGANVTDSSGATSNYDYITELGVDTVRVTLQVESSAPRIRPKNGSGANFVPGAGQWDLYIVLWG